MYVLILFAKCHIQMWCKKRRMCFQILRKKTSLQPGKFKCLRSNIPETHRPKRNSFHWPVIYSVIYLDPVSFYDRFTTDYNPSCNPC